MQNVGSVSMQTSGDVYVHYDVSPYGLMFHLSMYPSTIDLKIMIDCFAQLLHMPITINNILRNDAWLWYRCWRDSHHPS